MRTIKVKIREWNDMEKEFSLNRYGNIKCEGGFTKEAVSLCGKEVELEYDNEYKEWVELYTGKDWFITKDMIELEYRHLMKIKND